MHLVKQAACLAVEAGSIPTEGAIRITVKVTAGIPKP